jgi:hypothetical protein
LCLLLYTIDVYVKVFFSAETEPKFGSVFRFGKFLAFISVRFFLQISVFGSVLFEISVRLWEIWTSYKSRLSIYEVYSFIKRARETKIFFHTIVSKNQKKKLAKKNFFFTSTIRRCKNTDPQEVLNFGSVNLEFRFGLLSFGSVFGSKNLFGFTSVRFSVRSSTFSTSIFICQNQIKPKVKTSPQSLSSCCFFYYKKTFVNIVR